MKSTAEVLDHYEKCFAAPDIEGIMADYSADAVFIGREGLMRGPNASNPVFEKFFEFAKPGVFFARKQLLIESNYAYIVWSAGTPDSSYEPTGDASVIQNGSTRLHTFTAKVKPKH
jgi:ketosteroid isomerase-like protein